MPKITADEISKIREYRVKHPSLSNYSDQCILRMIRQDEEEKSDWVERARQESRIFRGDYY